LPYTVPALQQVGLFLDEKTLLQPLHWKKGRTIFPCSMTDWMADFVPDEWRDKMLAVMALTPQHTYLTLTKRADRQREYLSASIGRTPGSRRAGAIQLAADEIVGDRGKAHQCMDAAGWPIRNLWMGVSAENQKYWDERTSELNVTPAAVRWVSAEPLLSPIDCGTAIYPGYHEGKHAPGIDWVVVGGESGPGARSMNIEWARNIVSQCQAAGVAVFVKQLGAKPFLHRHKSAHMEKPGFKLHVESLEIKQEFDLNDRKGGDMSEWPEDLRVREYPQAAAERASA
jgi:protein gp37